MHTVTTERLRELASIPLAANYVVTEDEAQRNRLAVREALLFVADRIDHSDRMPGALGGGE